MDIFEKKVLDGFCNAVTETEKIQTSEINLGLAVSGGADSIAMLSAFSFLLKEKLIPVKNIFVITVNHYIRPDSETCGDAQFVMEFCQQLKNQGMNINSYLCELKKGQVSEIALQRGAGIEEAARFIRYQKFEEFIEHNNIDYLCLAHNQNDQLETLLMRFLQGSSGNALAGIQKSRNKYIRPLLNITRDEIESYLTSKHITWRTDSTNLDTEYLRNKIRHKLMPLLNQEFPGWQKAVLSGAEKQLNVNKVISDLVDEIEIKAEESSAFVSISDFCKYGEGVRIPLLFKMCNLVSSESRIPYLFLKDFCTEIEKNLQGKNLALHFSELEISYKNNGILVKKYVKTETDLCFFAIIEETGEYKFPFGSILFESDNSKEVSVFVAGHKLSRKFNLPLCVRNVQSGDMILTADGKLKKVNEVLSDWKIPEDKKTVIPVVQDLSDQQKILCILGSVAGFNDWIVKE